MLICFAKYTQKSYFSQKIRFYQKLHKITQNCQKWGKGQKMARNEEKWSNTTKMTKMSKNIQKWPKSVKYDKNEYHILPPTRTEKIYSLLHFFQILRKLPGTVYNGVVPTVLDFLKAKIWYLGNHASPEKVLVTRNYPLGAKRKMVF